MATTDTSRGQKLGLRERKKQRTRETIQKEALALFADRGYGNTTLEDIAEAAEVSTGTLFAYFPSKEDILFPEARSFQHELEQRIADRAADTTTIDVLRDLVAAREAPDETFHLRWKILEDESLRDRQRARYSAVQDLLTDAIAQDLHSPVGDLRPALLAAATTAAFTEVGQRVEPGSAPAGAMEQAIAILEQMLNLCATGSISSGQTPH
jgi:AcrR family transcriptional regulator